MDSVANLCTHLHIEPSPLFHLLSYGAHLALASPSVAFSLCASRKTLVLDLDETLVHSTVKPSPLASFAVEVYLEGNYCKFHVFKRPFVDHFLRQVRSSLRLDSPGTQPVANITRWLSGTT